MYDSWVGVRLAQRELKFRNLHITYYSEKRGWNSIISAKSNPGRKIMKKTIQLLEYFVQLELLVPNIYVSALRTFVSKKTVNKNSRLKEIGFKWLK